MTMRQGEVIASIEQLDSLPVGSTVRLDRKGTTAYLYSRTSRDRWRRPFGGNSFTTGEVFSFGRLMYWKWSRS